MLCRHPARVCPHAEADIAEAAGGVGTHPDGHTLAHLGTHPSPLSRAAWGQTLRFGVMCAEPPDVNSRLLRHPKCIVTPHIAAFSCDFEKNFFAASVEKLRQICGSLDG